jgi:hypothetical protein
MVMAARPSGQESVELSDTGTNPLWQTADEPEQAEELQADPKILCFSAQGSPNPCTRLATLYSTVTTVTSAAAFPASLATYHVVYVGHSDAAKLASKASQIQTFVLNGGGLIVEQPNATGPVALLPAGFEVNITSTAYSSQAVSYTLAGVFHPITILLNLEHPSGNFETVPTSSLGSGWKLLLKASGNPHAALVAGTY